MDLTKLKKSLEEILGVSVKLFGQKLMEIVISNNQGALQKIYDLLDGNLEEDNLQKVYQYYLADRKEKGQDFTPTSIGRLLSAITLPHGTVYDLCAGSGSLTIQAWRHCSNAEFICEEIDKESIPFLLANMVLRNMNGWVINRNALTLEVFAVYKLTSGDKFSKVETDVDLPDFEADVVISNPPYNLKWEAPDPLFADSRFSQHPIPPSSNANFAFVLTGLSKLKKDGKAAFVLPNGILTSETELMVRKSMVLSGKVNAVLALPDKMFEATSIPVCVAVFSFNNSDCISMVDCRGFSEKESRNQNGQHGGASHQQRVYSKTVNVFTSDQIAAIEESLTASVPNLSQTVSLLDVEKQGFNLSPSRYVEKEQEEDRGRPFKDIIEDINRVNREKNVVKLTINETWAKEIGLYQVATEHDKSVEITKEMEKTFSLFGSRPIEPDYIKLTKSKELKFENRDKEFLSSIFSMVLPMWSQHIYYLNNEENRLLAEFRDALLPKIMSGEISVETIPVELEVSHEKSI